MLSVVGYDQNMQKDCKQGLQSLLTLWDCPLMQEFFVWSFIPTYWGRNIGVNSKLVENTVI